jgi:hypothetical protein
MNPTNQLSREERILFWQRHFNFLFDAQKVIINSKNPEVIYETKKYMQKETKKRMLEFKKINANQLN